MLTTLALGNRRNTFCQLAAAAWCPSSTRIMSKKSGGNWGSHRSAWLASCWMLVTTNWLSMQSWMFAAGPSSTAIHGPAVKSVRTRVLVQKHSGLEMSTASVTPLRIVRLGVITRTRPWAMPKGSVAMIPVLPHPTGITMMAGSSDSAKCSRTARWASR